MPQAPRTRGYSARSGFVPPPALPTEHELVAAVLKQAVIDLQRGDAHQREAALRWLHDRKAVATWCDVVDLDVEHFRQQALRRAREA